MKQSPNMETLPMVFILGHNRSGTTLLQTILDAHPHTVAPLESRFAVHFYAKYGRVKRWSSQKKKQFINDLGTEDKIRLFWELDMDKLNQALSQLPESTNYAEVCKLVYASRVSLFPKKDLKLIIDKNPIYAFLTSRISEIFPKAKFIHIVRDYRATTNSALKLVPHAKASDFGYRWLNSNMEIENLKKVIPESFHTLTYESLLLNPEKEIAKVCSFLNITYESEMLNYHSVLKIEIRNYLDRSSSEEIRKMRDLGIAKVHKNLTQPINASFINKWKEILTQTQINELDKLCNYLGRNYNYALQSDSIPSATALNFKEKMYTKKLQWYYSLPIW